MAEKTADVAFFASSASPCALRVSVLSHFSTLPKYDASLAMEALGLTKGGGTESVRVAASFLERHATVRMKVNRRIFFVSSMFCWF